MIVEDQPAWNTHLRSSHALRRTPTRHFTDPSLAVAALRATPLTLLKDLNAFGLLFESMVVRDLRVYARPLEAELSITVISPVWRSMRSSMRASAGAPSRSSSARARSIRRRRI